MKSDNYIQKHTKTYKNKQTNEKQPQNKHRTSIKQTENNKDNTQKKRQRHKTKRVTSGTPAAYPRSHHFS